MPRACRSSSSVAPAGRAACSSRRAGTSSNARAVEQRRAPAPWTFEPMPIATDDAVVAQPRELGVRLEARVEMILGVVQVDDVEAVGAKALEARLDRRARRRGAVVPAVELAAPRRAGRHRRLRIRPRDAGLGAQHVVVARHGRASARPRRSSARPPPYSGATSKKRMPRSKARAMTASASRSRQRRGWRAERRAAEPEARPRRRCDAMLTASPGRAGCAPAGAASDTRRRGRTLRAHASMTSLSRRRAADARGDRVGVPAVEHAREQASRRRRVRRIGGEVVALVRIVVRGRRAAARRRDGRSASSGRCGPSAAAIARPPVHAGTVSVQVLGEGLVDPPARARRARRRAGCGRSRAAAPGAPSASTIVAATSSRFATCARRSPAGSRPGQRIRSGTRTESSYSVCFHHRPRSPSWSPWSVV